ncbi:MAG: FtsX-like permease family protein [Clostridia bacterium]
MKEKKKSKRLLRTSVMLLVFLLSLCSALSYGIWSSAKTCINKAMGGKISLAWLKESEFLPNSKSATQAYPYSLLQEAYTAANSSLNVDSVDIRFQCMAHAGVNTVVSDECGVSVLASVDKPYKDAVIVGTCEAIELKSTSKGTDSDGVSVPYFGYVVTLKIDKNLSPVLDSDYPYSYVRIMSSQVMEDFSDFFIVGSKYIAIGMVSYLNTPFEEDQAPLFNMASSDILLPTTDIKFEEYMYEKIGVPKGTKISYGRSYYDLTSCYFSAYTDSSFLSYAKIEGTLEEFLSSDENSRWNNIITSKKTAKESVKLVTVNNIESVPLFRSGRAYITQGSSFTDKDYSSGNKVCLISEQLAKSNNIKVGDVLDMTLWNAGYDLQTGPLGASWSTKPYSNKHTLSEKEGYTVTGIYTDDDAWNTQCCAFTPNTVFIPDSCISDSVKTYSSLTDLGSDRYTGMPDSRTYILKTGKASDFEAEMEKAGYGGMFYYCENSAPSLPYLNSLSDTFRTVTYISTSAFAVSILIIAIYAAVKNIEKTDKKTRLRTVLTVVIISVISIAVSAVISLSFYGIVINAANKNISSKEITEQVLKTEPTLPAPDIKTEQLIIDTAPTPLLMAFAVQTGTLLLVLCISSALCFVVKSGQKKKKVPYRLKKGDGVKGGMPAVLWYSIAQSARSTVMVLLMTVLVTLSGIFMFLSVSTWITAKRSISEAENAYTTIAVAAENEFVKGISPFKSAIYDYSSLVGIYEAAEKSEHVKYVDIRDKCMAQSNAIKTISSGMVDEYTPIGAVDYPYDLSVIVGTCVNVEYNKSDTAIVSDDVLDGTVIMCMATLELDRDQSFVLSEDFTFSRYMRVLAYVFDNDLSDGFKVGERYIVYGSKGYTQYPRNEMYRDSPVDIYPENLLRDSRYNRVADKYEYVKFEPYMHKLLGTDSSTTIHTRDSKGQSIRMKIENCYFRTYKDDAYMTYARLDGTLEQFLSSDKGQKWKKHIEECKTTVTSLKMNFTGNLDSILLFNQNLAYITEGRTFTKEEYSEGAKVCIISAETAKHSGIKVGDRIDFKFWSNGCNITKDYAQPIWVHNAFVDGCDFIDEGTFEVIGIYKAENVWSTNEFFLTPNNAFAPKGSIKGQIEYNLPKYVAYSFDEKAGRPLISARGTYQSLPNTRSLVIKPGHIEAFEKEMESLGYGGMFYYYDQGFSAIASVLNSLKESTALLMYISVAVWIVVMSAFFIIMTSRAGKTAGIMMSLGMNRNQIFMHMFTMFMCIILISGIVSGAIGYGMYDNIVGKIYQEAKEDNVNLDFSSFKTDQTISGTYDSSLIESFDIKKSPGTVLLMCGIQLIVLSGAAAITAKRYSMKEPLELLKGKGGRKKKK